MEENKSNNKGPHDSFKKTNYLELAKYDSKTEGPQDNILGKKK